MSQEIDWEKENQTVHVFTCQLCGGKSSGGDTEHHPLVATKCWKCGGVESAACPPNCRGTLFLEHKVTGLRSIQKNKQSPNIRKVIVHHTFDGNANYRKGLRICTCDGAFCRQDENDYTNPRCVTCGGLIPSDRLAEL